MGTQAVIGRTLGTEPDSVFRGRYVHYDGDPLGIGPELVAMLAARDGSVERLLKTLTIDHFAWSGLDHTQTAETPRGGGPVYAVPGVGVAYSDAEPIEWIEGTIGGGPEAFLGDWAYLFDGMGSDAGLVVARISVRSGLVVLERLLVRYLHLMEQQDWKVIMQKGRYMR